MSHQLRTPLNAIIGYSEMLQEEAADAGGEAFVPDLQRIHGAGRHLLEPGVGESSSARATACYPRPDVTTRADGGRLR
jgi:hypothetical protein